MAATSDLDLGQLIYEMRAENGLSRRELSGADGNHPVRDAVQVA